MNEEKVTVGMLIRTLMKIDSRTLVVLSKDSEGNSFSPMDSFSKDEYIPISDWEGELYFDEMGEKPKNTVPCIVLWPTN